MSVQPLLPFEDVPITDSAQARYHAIAPCLAGKVQPRQQAVLLNLSYFNRFPLAQTVSGRRNEGTASDFGLR